MQLSQHHTREHPLVRERRQYRRSLRCLAHHGITQAARAALISPRRFYHPNCDSLALATAGSLNSLQMSQPTLSGSANSRSGSTDSEGRPPGI
jgi:hypothetical protein